MGEIKNISKYMNDHIELEYFDYKNYMAEMMICARIDYRHRIEINFSENCWIQELMVYYLDQHNKLYFKNLDHLLAIKYCLGDASHLISVFPNS